MHCNYFSQMSANLREGGRTCQVCGVCKSALSKAWRQWGEHWLVALHISRFNFLFHLQTKQRTASDAHVHLSIHCSEPGGQAHEVWTPIHNLRIPRSILVGLLHVIHITLCTLTMWLYLHCPLLHNWHSSKVWKIKSTSIRSDESNWPGRLEGREMNGHIHALPLADKYEIAETRLQYKGELFFHFQQNWSAQNKN
jgi:hypothetical protein